MKKLTQLHTQYEELCQQIRDEAKKQIQKIGTAYRCGKLTESRPTFFQNILSDTASIPATLRWMRTLAEALPEQEEEE